MGGNITTDNRDNNGDGEQKREKSTTGEWREDECDSHMNSYPQPPS